MWREWYLPNSWNVQGFLPPQSLIYSAFASLLGPNMGWVSERRFLNMFRKITIMGMTIKGIRCHFVFWPAFFHYYVSTSLLEVQQSITTEEIWVGRHGDRIPGRTIRSNEKYKFNNSCWYKCPNFRHGRTKRKATTSPLQDGFGLCSQLNRNKL